MSVIVVIQEMTETFLVSKFENKLYYFSLIVRLIANICNDQFMHDSWLLDYVADLKHASSENVAWMNEFICISSEMGEEEACA